jgi:sRNA-binding regulator protein Hfq
MADPINMSQVELPEAPAAAAEVAGPRKLVRPKLLPEQLSGKRQRREPPALLAHQEMAPASSSYNGAHAEVFYYQKQMHAQTAMVFVLDDGERIEGVIEWFDRNVVKVRHVTRTMIYKSSIKYLFKASDAHSPHNGLTGTGG